MTFNKLCSLTFFFTLLTIGLVAQTIADVRAQALGSTVTVRGVVTNGPELGKIRYLQDGTAGIAAYAGTGSVPGFDSTVFPGDSIEVTGTLVSFQGLLEITPITAFNIISSGHPLPAPHLISLGQIDEALESQLVAFECVSFANAGGTFSAAGNYDIADTEGNTSKVYLRSGHPMLGSAIPMETTWLTGILSRYFDFQILPRTTADFQPGACFFFTQTLEQADINTNSFAVSWKTNLPSNGILWIDTNPNPANGFTVASTTTDHSFTFPDLLPGTIYWVQIQAEHNGETILSEPRPFATRSLSSGQIKVFFNQGLDPAYTNGLAADGETYAAVLSETLARINAAQQTLDVAVYNNNRDDITQALEAAKARGVRVRYVAAEAASNVALDPAPTFPVLYGNNDAIMHNKFLVIDADITNKAWVMSGSLNWTNQNMIYDFNNTLFIQDQSLARAYELEFEEMWGGPSDTPQALNSRFGSSKRDNTPHRFIIGGHAVESYFSPSDQTNSHLDEVLRSAQSEALFATFSFTKNDLGDAIVAVHNAGVPVRGIMENISDVGAEYEHLLNNGVAVRHHNLPGEFHHKYGVVDANDLDSDPTVVTGSHNWSVSAETINDENTLVLHDPTLATLFKAEFEKRWGEFPVPVYTVQNQPLRLFPNPASDWIVLQETPTEAGTFLVKNALGQVVLSADRLPDAPMRLQVSALPAGQYYLTFIGAHVVASVPFQKI